VVEAREVDMAVLLPLVLLPLDRVPLIEVAVGGLLPLHRHRHRHRRRRQRGWRSGIWTLEWFRDFSAPPSCAQTNFFRPKRRLPAQRARPPPLQSCWTPAPGGWTPAMEPNWAEMSSTWAAAGNLCFVGRWGQPESRFELRAVS